MRAVTLVLLSVVATALAGSFVKAPEVEKTYTKEYVRQQKLVTQFFRQLHQLTYNDVETEELVKDFQLQEHFDDFTNVEVAKHFWHVYNNGRIMPMIPFTIFNSEMRQQAIALFKLFYYAKDFEVFYKTALWARHRVNSDMLAYSFPLAVRLRPDTKDMILPVPYEVNPNHYVANEAVYKAQVMRMQGNIKNQDAAINGGILEGDNIVYIVANYTGWFNYLNEEQKISYFTEDAGLNTFYFKYQLNFPYWIEDDAFGVDGHRRGEIFFFVHRQLLARYYLERQANGLGEIPEFSWRLPIETGYNPSLESIGGIPFFARENYFELSKNADNFDLDFVESWEQTFRKIINLKYSYSADGKVQSLKDEFEGLEYLFEFFQHNHDVYENNYEIIARRLLGNYMEKLPEHYVTPSALLFYDTSLRDPMFWQLYSRVMSYVAEYKNSFPAYTTSELAFPGVNIEKFEVNKLVTYYSYFDSILINSVWFPKEFVSPLDMKMPYARQARLNHKPFTFTIDVNSDKEVEAVVKFFVGPKYDSNGYAISLDNNRNQFIEIDWFVYKLSAGKNTIVRNSNEFSRFSEDQPDVLKTFIKAGEFLNGTGTFDIDDNAYRYLPHGLLLPKGSKSGFPVQFFAMVYPYQIDAKYAEKPIYKALILDQKSLGYPLDKPIDNTYFFQPNMYVQDALVYHQGDELVHNYGKPEYFNEKTYSENVVKA